MQPYILILNTDSTLEDGRIEGRKATFQKEKTKGTVGSYVESRDAIGRLVAEAAATVDLLLRSMGLKYFNRHGLYGMATLATRKYPPFDRLLFFSPPFSFGCFCTGRDSSLRPPASSSTNASLVLPPNGAHRSLRPLFAVIARNHTRGHYENDSADAYFFFFSFFLYASSLALSLPLSPVFVLRRVPTIRCFASGMFPVTK